jgi:hypothetical protein
MNVRALFRSCICGNEPWYVVRWESNKHLYLRQQQYLIGVRSYRKCLQIQLPAIAAFQRTWDRRQGLNRCAWIEWKRRLRTVAQRLEIIECACTGALCPRFDNVPALLQPSLVWIVNILYRTLKSHNVGKGNYFLQRVLTGHNER